MEYKITNYVTVSETSHRHDLGGYISRMEIGSYCPQTYSAMTIKSVDPGGTIILFASGNMTVMGSSSKFNSMNKMLDLKQAHSFHCNNLRLTNIVATCQISNHIDLGEMYMKWPQYCDYDPDIFPGCTVNIPDSTMKVNVFLSGKVVVSGGSSLEKVEEALTFVHNLL